MGNIYVRCEIRTGCPSGDPWGNLNEIHFLIYRNILLRQIMYNSFPIQGLMLCILWGILRTIKTRNSTPWVTQGAKDGNSFPWGTRGNGNVILSHEWHMGFFLSDPLQAIPVSATWPYDQTPPSYKKMFWWLLSAFLVVPSQQSQ